MTIGNLAKRNSLFDFGDENKMMEERLGNIELVKPFDPHAKHKTNLNLFIEMEYLRLLALA